MKILHYLTDIDLRSGGVVRAVLDLCNALGALHLDVTLAFCGDAGGLTPNGKTRLRQIGHRPNIFGRFSTRAVSELRALIQNSDVVHLHTPWDRANLQVARLCREHGVPYVISPHGMLDDWSMGVRTLKKTLYLRTVGRRLISSARLVHCTAEEERRQATKRLFKTPTVVIPLVLDLAPYRILPGERIAREGLSDKLHGDFLMLFLSRVHKKKGLDYAIKALALLRSAGVPASLVIAGSGDPGYLSELRTLARGLQVECYCQFVGVVAGAIKVSLFQVSHVLVLPTSQENFGLVLPEALAAGLPVITTKNVAIWRELRGSGGVEIVERSAQAFAQAVRELYFNPERRVEMGTRGRKWAMEIFSGPDIARRYEAMYRETVNTRAQTGLSGTSSQLTYLENSQLDRIEPENLLGIPGLDRDR